MLELPLVILSAAAAAASVTGASANLPVKLETRSDLNSRLANVHVRFDSPVDGTLTYTYGDCGSTEQRDAHHQIARGTHTTSESRLVWVHPEDLTSQGCISAWAEDGSLVGRSAAQQLQPLRRRNGSAKNTKRGEFSIPMNNATGIDTWGPWFDGVELLASKNLSAVDVAEAKCKEVAIVGAGMSGLMTYLVLHQAGMTNLKILEAGQRLGGRVHTAYLSGGPFDYSYQEMGPMRFPETIEYGNKSYDINDHKLVFQLAAEMNNLNGHDANFSVDFIPWIQNNDNGLYYYDGVKLANGLPPTQGQIANNASLSALYPPELVNDPSTEALEKKYEAIFANETFMIEVAQNMFQAHADFLANGLGGLGGDTWSEFAYMVNYLNASLNDTDVVGGADTSFWGDFYDDVYFDAATWRTIDGGLSRLPESFHPLVDNVTDMNTRIERIAWQPETQRVELQWRHNYTDRVFQNETYDYAIMALPFSQVKKMRMSPELLPTTISNAIQKQPFEAACKVALEYETRFWEHYAENPIFGGCSTTTDIYGIGSICYPSYCLNCTGPATMLASYISGADATNWLSATEEEHVHYMVDAMAEIHGEVAREQWTGKYNRRCWALDPLEGGSWASPTIGQHQLYLPEFFKTYNNIIFVGEQTSYTHAWIASALESGIRGGVQLLLELGLVDEAKFTVEKWMARWIDV